MKNWRRVVTVISIWVLVNVIGVYAIGWYERTSLEKKFGLRPGILSEFESREISVATGASQFVRFHYRVHTPEDISDGEKLPVVLYLHGAGERGRSNARQLRSVPTLLTCESYRNLYRSVILVPQCPNGWRWSQFRTVGKNSDVVMKMVDAVVDEPWCDSSRVYLIGFSMGSFGAWELAAEYSQRFAACIPICGGASESQAERLTSVPIWTVHGDCDQTCPVDATRTLVAKIRSLGGNCNYTELESTGHSAWRLALESTGCLDWLFRQEKTNLDLASRF